MEDTIKNTFIDPIMDCNDLLKDYKNKIIALTAERDTFYFKATTERAELINKLLNQGFEQNKAEKAIDLCITEIENCTDSFSDKIYKLRGAIALLKSQMEK